MSDSSKNPQSGIVSNIPVRAVLFAITTVGLAKLLHSWMIEDQAWGVATFFGSLLFYELPPRLAPKRSRLTSVVWSLCAGVVVLVLSKMLTYLIP